MSDETTLAEKGKVFAPKLRFKDFHEQWTTSSLNQLIKELIDCEHKTAPYVDNSEYLVVRTNNIKNGELVYEDMKFTSEEGFNEWTKRGLPEHGDLLLTREAPAGESCLVPKDIKVCLGQRMVLLKPNSKMLLGAFLSFYLQSNPGKKSIENVTIGTTVTRINIADIYRLKCPLTSLIEQQKIASFLSAVDEKIRQLTRKRELLEHYKKGVMQQLFSGKLRFKDENGKPFPKWEVKRLGDIVDFLRGSPLSKSDLNEDGKYFCIHYGELFTIYKEVIEKVFSRTDKGEGMLSEIGDILMPSSDVTPKGLAKASSIQLDKVILGGDMNILRPKEVDSIFLSYLLNFNQSKIIQIVTGTTVKHIYNKDVKILQFSFPSPKEEQQKIASFLTALDSKIGTVSSQIDNVQKFKKELLQQMFV